MARFEVQGVQVACPQCGGTDHFQHEPTILTCNKDGHVFETATPATVMIEQVVTTYADSSK